MEAAHKCETCQLTFSTKSSLVRHEKTHKEKEFVCSECGKKFTLKQNAISHKRVHFYPQIPLYKRGEARLKCSTKASEIAKRPQEKVGDQFRCQESAEKEAKKCEHELWRGDLIICFGKYSGQSFKWLLENDVGWVVWLVSRFILTGESNPELRWQKERLLEYVGDFSLVMDPVNQRVRAQKKDTPTPTPDFKPEAEYVEDADLLSLAKEYLEESEVAVTSEVTTVGSLRPSPVKEDIPSTSNDRTDEPLVTEGWQKTWEEPPGMYAPNVPWLKSDGPHGIFQASKSKRKIFKPKMEFQPPPLPTTIRGSLPSMLSFFTTPVFFWRPVGVMEAKIKCPNASCPAPPGTFLSRSGYGDVAREVCGLRHNYTVLTERLKCHFCQKARQRRPSTADDQPPVPYRWHAYSPSILMQLAPAVRKLFPAIICGKRAVDKGVAALLADRLNAASMTKVHRLVEQGHDEWYTDRLDLYQTLLTEAQSASTPTSSQLGILPFTQQKYTPPIPPAPIPSPRVLRRAHLIMEMERMAVYRASITSVTGEILCIDGTKQILKKIYGDGKGTMQYVTSVLNEWGQFLTTIVVASEAEESYSRMARGLVARFQRANAPTPKVLYADNNCCRDGGTSWLESLFEDWTADGMVIRLDIRHWLHRWDAVVVKQSHAKYGIFMSSLAGAILAYNADDMSHLIRAIRNGDKDYSQYTDEEMLAFVKPHQASCYVRRLTRGVQESACAIEHILAEFKGPAGLDIDGIPLFKSEEAVNAHWINAKKHLSCMQDPPNIQLYVTTKVVTINGIPLNKYKCRRGSNALEGLHSHLLQAIPSKRCGIVPFQVYLISFAVQWNARMEKLKVAGGQGRRTSCIDPRQLQRINEQGKALFGKDHVYEPNFSAPMAADPAEEELLGVEYAYSQSTDYIQKAEEEADEEAQTDSESEAESEDEGIDEDGAASQPEDPLEAVSLKHVVLSKDEQVVEEVSPLMEDVLMRPTNLHLPGFQEVEDLALLLLKLTEGEQHIIPAPLRQEIVMAAGKLHEHDRSARNFVKKYESTWGYTLFGRCLGRHSPESSAAQKTKFGWMRFAQAASITDESRLLYLLIKILKNQPSVSGLSSPTKTASKIKAQYKRIADRVRDDPFLSAVDIPLPNINAKSITVFLSKEEKRGNYLATAQPKVRPHRRVLSKAPIPEAVELPASLPPPSFIERKYESIPHQSGKRYGEKRRALDFSQLSLPGPSSQSQDELPIPKSPPLVPKVPRLAPKPSPSPSLAIPPGSSGIPVLVVVPAQPKAQTISLPPIPSLGLTVRPPPPPPPKPSCSVPKATSKPCTACNLPNCGGVRKKYVPSKEKTVGSTRKKFTFCAKTNRGVTPGFTKDYDSYEHFVQEVDAELARQKDEKKNN